MRASDHLHLPDTVQEDIEVPLPEAARAIYKELERELLVAIGNEGDVVAQTAATLVNKLLQITGGFVYNEEKKPIQVHTAKIDALKAIIKKHAGENLLVACHYIHEREGICAAIPGAVDASKVKGDLETQWNEGKFKVLVAGASSLGHGLNLQKGGRAVCWYSQTYDREMFDQFNARLVRKGQGEETFIYRLVCPNSIDEAAVETLRERGAGQSQMLAVLNNFRKQVLTA
jgi:SNF2 family DNA or RNA helicase